MIRCEYRIHLINGEIVRVSEDVKTEDERLLTQFKKLSENGVLEIGFGHDIMAFIPARNILLMDATPAYEDDK